MAGFAGERWDACLHRPVVGARGRLVVFLLDRRATFRAFAPGEFLGVWFAANHQTSGADAMTALAVETLEPAVHGPHLVCSRPLGIGDELVHPQPHNLRVKRGSPAVAMMRCQLMGARCSSGCTAGGRNTADYYVYAMQKLVEQKQLVEDLGRQQ
ncbi:MAG TPA: hypothetical protein VJT13_14290 [Xanthobacteraceae bacterium]|nr:hypothetical protein [Xanthobacteraceae bacterium]